MSQVSTVQDPLLFRKYVQVSAECLVNRTVQVLEDAHCLEELSSVLTTVKKDSKEKCLEMFQVN